MKKLSLILAIIMLANLFAGCAAPVEEPAPVEEAPAGPEFAYITPEEVAAMIEGGDDFHLIDIQPADYYALGHLPGSVSTEAYPVDTNELKAKLDSTLESIKEDDTIVVIAGLGGKTAAENAFIYYLDNGIDASRLYILEGGMMGWTNEELLWTNHEYQYITQAEMKEKLDSRANMLIIDVRQPEYFNAGHFQGAVNTASFPNNTREQWNKLDEQIEAINNTIDPIVLVCMSGKIGAINAISYYATKGIDDRKFYILEGGGQGWSDTDTLVRTPDFQYITPADMKAKIEAEEEMLLLSIQTKDNYRKTGHLPDSIATYAFPADTPELLEELADHVDALTENELPIYIMCHGGKLGATNSVTYYVNEFDIDETRFFIIEGGITNWPYPEMLELGR